MIADIRGDVTVSPDVAIAPGVILEAVPGSRLVVESGVCLGTGVIIQAYGGELILAVHVSVGKDALLVGAGRVGPRACIGAESTLINPRVKADGVIAARSLLGVPTSTAATAKTVNPSPAEPETCPADEAATASVASNGALATANPVYGREQVMQLVKTLFPHRDLLNSNGNGSGNGHVP